MGLGEHRDTIYLIDFGSCSLATGLTINSTQKDYSKSQTIFRGAFNVPIYESNNITSSKAIENQSLLPEIMDNDDNTIYRLSQSKSKYIKSANTMNFNQNKSSKAVKCYGTLSYSSANVIAFNNSSSEFNNNSSDTNTWDELNQSYLTFPRDDLEGLIYTLAYFLKGRLPWSNKEHSIASESSSQSLANSNTLNMMLMKEVSMMKQSCDIKDLCGVENDGSMIERVLSDMLEYCRRISRTSKPDYNMLLIKVNIALNHYNDACKSSEELTWDWEEQGISWSDSDGSLKSMYYD